MGGGAGWDTSNRGSKFSVPRTPKSSWRPHKDLFVLVEKCMALGKVKVQGGVGSARRDTKDKRARVHAFRVHIGVHGMEDGIPPKG